MKDCCKFVSWKQFRINPNKGLVVSLDYFKIHINGQHIFTTDPWPLLDPITRVTLSQLHQPPVFYAGSMNIAERFDQIDTHFYLKPI